MTFFKKIHLLKKKKLILVTFKILSNREGHTQIHRGFYLIRYRN